MRTQTMMALLLVTLATMCRPTTGIGSLRNCMKKCTKAFRQCIARCTYIKCEKGEIACIKECTEAKVRCIAECPSGRH
ncbi:hypothetical protein LSAT2_017072 [Lamellibrachia satsuma]|nr:hypothetical protein LSAT2_017072 [Lamellibrachia satsuma]